MPVQHGYTIPSVSHPGDIWGIDGRHRIGHGSSTNRDFVLKVVGTQKPVAEVMGGSPVLVKSNNDERLTADEWTRLMIQVVRAVEHRLKPGGRFYFNYKIPRVKGADWDHDVDFIKAVAPDWAHHASHITKARLESDLNIHRPVLQLGSGMQPVKSWGFAAPVVDKILTLSRPMEGQFRTFNATIRNKRPGATSSTGVRDGSGTLKRQFGVSNEFSSAAQGVVLLMHNCERDTVSMRVHQGTTPFEYYIEMMLRHTQPDDVVFDPFCGTGSSVVAAQESHRVCYGVEINKKNVDAALDRIRRRYSDMIITRRGDGAVYDDLVLGSERVAPRGDKWWRRQTRLRDEKKLVEAVQ